MTIRAPSFLNLVILILTSLAKSETAGDKWTSDWNFDMLLLSILVECSDYRRMDEHDWYDSLGMDETFEDERDFDQIMADRRAAKVERHTGWSCGQPQAPSTPARSGYAIVSLNKIGRPPRPRDHTDDDPFDMEEDDDEGEFETYKVQGTLREWVIRFEVHRFIAKKFKEFLLTYSKNDQGEPEYVKQINEMVSVIDQITKKCILEVDYKQFIYVHPNIAIWLADAPQPVLEVMEEVAERVIFNLHEKFRNIHRKIYVRITNLPVYDQICNIRQIHLNTMIRIGGVVT
ncbi:hypothetical protein MLD38_011827 [Melastoma candidum]|uniref:Uncharacterized protein n=1 Tax=Melastoma candidum TaxID=119954 RepID=A0ACB9R3R1_9MYRT|nr:hypothetical protein MLD38_011827 [Melastoma candidum]